MSISMHGFKCLLIADDLTGACDASVQFTRQGHQTVVSLGLDFSSVQAAVLGFSTNSRDMEPEWIQALMRDLAARLAVRDARVIFKKIDSTLRGHAGCEIAAALVAFNCEAAVIAPAFPAMGRVVEAGFLRVESDTRFQPIELRGRLESQGAGPCTHVAADGVSAALDSGARFISVDAVCDGDLDVVVAAGLASGRRLLWAGSAGLASALAGAMSPEATSSSDLPKGAAGVLFCIGSDHPVTMAQQHRLLSARRSLLAHPEQLTCDCLAFALARGEHVVLRLPRGRFAPAALRELLANAHPAALVLSGGDTASLVCEVIEVARIELRREIARGIPAGILGGGIFDQLPVVTKSGGFGAVDDLIMVADYFHA